jgi:hypothetical protein
MQWWPLENSEMGEESAEAEGELLRSGAGALLTLRRAGDGVVCRWLCF